MTSGRWLGEIAALPPYDFAWDDPMVSRLPAFTLPILAILLLGTGCSTVPQSNSELQTTNQAMPPNQPMILVEFQSPEQGGTEVKLPLAAAPTVQAAVEKSKAPSKYKRFHIAVSRLPQQPGGVPQKLISKYNHVEQRIAFEYDYQLQAGDRVVIYENPSNTMDDLFGTVLSPLRNMAGMPPVDKSPF